MGARAWYLWAAYGGTWLVLGLGLVLPVLLVLGAGLRPALLLETLANPIYQAGLRDAAGIACVTTLLALALALPLAWLRARRRHPGQGLGEALLLLPLILPPFVGAIGLHQLVGYHGAFNSLLVAIGLLPPGGGIDWLGQHRFAMVCLLEALHLYPIAYLYLANALRGIDENLLEAARAAGAGPATVLWRVVVPLLRPALFAAGSITWIWSFTELGTPLLLGYRRVTPVQIFEGLSGLERDHTPFALVVILLLVVAVIYLATRGLLLRGERRLSAGIAKATGPRATARPLGRSGTALAWMLILGVVGMAAAPHLAVALVALGGDWYGSILPPELGTAFIGQALSHPLVVPAIGNSLRYAGLATIGAVVLGAFIAYTGSRWRPPGARALDLLAMLPLAVPGLVIAFGMLALLGLCRQQGLDGLAELLDPTRDPTLLLVLAYGIRRLPYAVRAVAAGYSQLPPVYEEAAAACGAGPWQRLRRIVVPLLAGSLLAGALLTFSFCMLEVADSLILAQRQETYPITKVIYELVTLLGSGPAVACAFALWAMCFLGLALALAGSLLGGRLGDLLRRQG